MTRDVATKARTNSPLIQMLGGEFIVHGKSRRRR
jgi:hypothetical protein